MNNNTIWAESISASEAAERLIEYVRRIRELDAQYDQMMRDKAAVYREAKKGGLNKLAVKTIANDPRVDNDDKALRKYLALIVSDEAAATMKDAGHFGTILFGEADSFPSDYTDPKHGTRLRRNDPMGMPAHIRASRGMPSAFRAASGRPGRVREEAEDLTPEERPDSVEKDVDWHKGSMTDMRDRLEKLEREYTRLVNFANALGEAISGLQKGR